MCVLLLLLYVLLLQLLVLDEADEMLSMNFTEQIYNCYRYLPPDCQVRPHNVCWRGGRGAFKCALVMVCRHAVGILAWCGR
jgi:hypothetical protein